MVTDGAITMVHATCRITKVRLWSDSRLEPHQSGQQRKQRLSGCEQSRLGCSSKTRRTHLQQVPDDDGVRDNDEGFRPECQLVDAAAVQEPVSGTNPCQPVQKLRTSFNQGMVQAI